MRINMKVLMKKNIFLFNEEKPKENNLSKTNIFIQENNQDNQPKKKFKSMFEDDDDNKITFKKEEKKKMK